MMIGFQLTVKFMRDPDIDTPGDIPGAMNWEDLKLSQVH